MFAKSMAPIRQPKIALSSALLFFLASWSLFGGCTQQPAKDTPVTDSSNVDQDSNRATNGGRATSDSNRSNSDDSERLLISEADWGQYVGQLCNDQKVIRIQDFAINDRLFVQIPPMEGLETLQIDEGILSDEALMSLDRFSNLVHLRIRQSRILDQGAASIAQLPKLKIVNLPQADLTDQGLLSLAKIPTIELLRIGSPQVTDEGLKALADHPTLKYLHLIQIECTDECLASLASIPNLQSLYIDGGKVSSAGWSEWFSLRPDVHVHIDQFHHDLDPNRHDHDDTDQ